MVDYGFGKKWVSFFFFFLRKPKQILEKWIIVFFFFFIIVIIKICFLGFPARGKDGFGSKSAKITRFFKVVFVISRSSHVARVCADTN